VRDGSISNSEAFKRWIIIGSHRRPETKQGILKADREWLGIGLGLGIIDRRSEPDRRSEAINFGAC